MVRLCGELLQGRPAPTAEREIVRPDAGYPPENIGMRGWVAFPA